MGPRRSQSQLAAGDQMMSEIDGENDDTKTAAFVSASDTVNIDTRGDMVLLVKHHKYTQEYRVSVASLRKISPFFAVLLDPVKFSEGAAVRTRLIELERSHADTALVPAVDLPRVSVVISDVGEASKTNISSAAAFRMTFVFLGILHNPDTFIQCPSIHFISILALIADRFDAAAPISLYLKKSGWKQKLSRPTFTHKSKSQLELNRRKKLYTGIIFGFQDWVHQYSAELIYEGSEKWLSDSTEIEEEPPWLYLPYGIEGMSLLRTIGASGNRVDHACIEELFYRRSCIFDTLGSVQDYVLGPYLHNLDKPQCRLGYDSSWQCDSFQLGQTIRYLTRKGALSVRGTFAPVIDAPQYADSIEDLLTVLRQCPTYQLDNHSHCGPRAKLEPALRSITPALSQTGICLYCWKRNRAEDSWRENPAGGKWYLGMPRLKALHGQCHDHRTAKALCTAEERDWTPPNLRIP